SVLLRPTRCSGPVIGVKPDVFPMLHVTIKDHGQRHARGGSRVWTLGAESGPEFSPARIAVGGLRYPPTRAETGAWNGAWGSDSRSFYGHTGKPRDYRGGHSHASRNPLLIGRRSPVSRQGCVCRETAGDSLSPGTYPATGRRKGRAYPHGRASARIPPCG